MPRSRGVGESSSTDSSYSVGSERLDCSVVSRLSRPEHGSRSGDAGRGTKHRRADTCLRSIQTSVFGFEPCGSSPGGAVPVGLVGAQALPALSKCRVTNPNVEPCGSLFFITVCPCCAHVLLLGAWFSHRKHKSGKSPRNFLTLFSLILNKNYWIFANNACL